jgi:hypothetical protein
MASLQKKNTVYKFAEPNYIPISGNKHLSQQTDTDLNSTILENLHISINSLNSDLNNMKIVQQHTNSNIDLLINLCNKIDKSINELNTNDVDEASNSYEDSNSHELPTSYELLNVKDPESYDIESQINLVNIDPDKIQYDGDSEISTLIKPKRKYTKKINK